MIPRSSTSSAKRQYEDMASSTAPTQDDVGKNHKMPYQHQQRHLHEIIDLDDSDTPVQLTPVQLTPVQLTPAQKTPVQKTPAQKTPVQKTPAQKTPVQLTPAQKTPVQKTPVQKTPVQKTPVQQTPVRQMTPTTPDDTELLMEELNQLNLRAVQLENRAISAESGYQELKQLKEVEAREHFNEYKTLADRRFKASEMEIQTLRELTDDQTQHLSRITSRMEITRAELGDLKSSSSSRKTQHEETVKKYHRSKERYEMSNKKADLLREELRSLQKGNERLEQQNQKDADAIPRLRHRLKLYGELTGLDILDYKSSEIWDVYTCSQTGRNGRVSYKLTFLKDDQSENEPMARYEPLISESDPDLLPAYLNEELEFVQSDCNIFFLRITTLLNKT